MPNSPPAKKAREDNCIMFRIRNVSQLKNESVLSEETNIGGFPWNLSVFKGDDRLSIDLFCFQEEKSNAWCCDVSCQYILINQIDSTNNRKSEIKNYSYHWYDYDQSLCWEDEKISEIMDPQAGFVKNDEIVVHAYVNVLGRAGNEFRKKPAFDFRSPSETSDITLKINDEKFYVHKQILFIHSPKFLKYIQGNEMEKKAFEALLKDVDANAFENMMRMLYRVSEPFPIGADNVTAVLELSVLFEIEGILDEADKSLKLMEFDNDILFFWAEKYKLFCLENWVFENITVADIKIIKQSDEYKGLTEQTKEKLFDKYIELSESTDSE